MQMLTVSYEDKVSAGMRSDLCSGCVCRAQSRSCTHTDSCLQCWHNWTSHCRMHPHPRIHLYLSHAAQQNKSLLLTTAAILYGHTVILIIGIPSPTHSFVPDVKPPSSPNPYHCNPSFPFRELTTWIPRTVHCYFWAYPFLLFSFFSVLHFLVVGSVR